MSDHARLYTLDEVAEILRCSITTVRRLVKTGRLPAGRVTEGGSARHLIRATEVDRLLRECGLGDQPEATR